MQAFNVHPFGHSYYDYFLLLKVGISGKASMSDQAGKSGVAGKLTRCSVRFCPVYCLNRKPIATSFSIWYRNNVAFPVELNWFWNNLR
jgi:hypothetical protein